MKIIFFFSLLLLRFSILNAQWYKIPQSQVSTIYTINSIKFINSNIGFAVGAFGTIIKTNNGGSSWVNISYSNLNYLNVWLTDSNTVYAVGEGGSIIKTIDGGNNWYQQISGTSNTLSSIFFTDINTGFITGDNGVILKTINGGINWFFVTIGTTQPLYSIFFVDTNKGFAVGLNIILQTIDNGITWTQQLTNINLKSVFFSDENTGYSSGYEVDNLNDNYGVIYKTTNAGISWNRIYNNFSYSGLYSVFFLNNLNGYSVGDGPVLKTTDGGFSWNQQWETNNNLRDVYFVNDSVGFAVGISGSIYKTTNGGENYIENYSLKENNFDIFPNPFSNSTSIVFQNSQHPPYTISIIDLFGNIKRIYSNIKNDKIEIDKGNLNKGIYFIEISGEKNYKEKLIVQ